MRPLKFRIWVEGKMIYFDDLTLESFNKEVYKLTFNQSNEGYIHDDHLDTSYAKFDTMQYTGLKDKNGKEIYESDIVKDEFNEIYEIKYLVDFASFGMEEIGNRTYLNFLGRIFTEDKDYYQWEVIGNIHESPDLLEK
jgi:uncharacterized phage protein (TIGR01671 family)